MKKQAIALAMATLMAASMTACSGGSKTETTAAATAKLRLRQQAAHWLW